MWLLIAATQFFDQAHTRIGTIVVALLGLQPFLGYAHHALYKKVERRTIISFVHIWSGRILIVLGIVAGGLGLSLASAPWLSQQSPINQN